jgi:hypothetical protein
MKISTRKRASLGSVRLAPIAERNPFDIPGILPGQGSPLTAHPAIAVDCDKNPEPESTGELEQGEERIPGPFSLR